MAPELKKKSHIEKLKEKLYSPKSKDSKVKLRGELYEDPHPAPTEWKKEIAAPVKKRKNLLENTMFKRFFFGAIIFFVLAVGFGLFMFFGGSNTVSADNIEINILGNAFVSGGEELPLKIELINRNNVALEYSDLLLEYQKGAGAGEDIQRDRFTVGTIPAGGKVEKLVDLVLFGQQGTTRDINITLEYRVKGSSAIFIKPEIYVVNISSTPVNLVVDGPDVTNTNQDISFDITTSLNTEDAVSDMMVVVDYPPGFDFKSATPEPSFSNNIWALGDLDKGAEKLITINGVIVAESGEQRAFNIYTGKADPLNEQQIGTQFNSQNYIIAVEKPFLDLRFTVNGSTGPDAVAKAGEFAEGSIEFDNNLDTKITDIEVTAKFSGNAFDINAVNSQDGFYDTTKQTIIWNSQTKPKLGNLDPGDDDELSFSFRPISFSDSSIKNPEINVEVSVRARQPSISNDFQEIDNFTKKKVKFSTQLQITGHALYQAGPFQNSGPLPPSPGQPTSYTIVWSIANTINKVTNAKVRTVLPLYVDWADNISPAGQSVTFNSATREVVWDIGNIDSGVGTSSSPRQLNFQVKINPSGSQSGTTPNLIMETVFTGKDSFTGVEINKSASPVTTRLNRDSNYNSQNDSVE